MRKHKIADRIVSLAPSVTETLYALGLSGHLCARTDFCDWPDKVHTLPSVGGFSSCDMNNIMKFDPDLVIGTPLHENLLRTIKTSGVRTVSIPAYPVFEAPETIRCVGRAIDAPDAADKLAVEIQKKIMSIKEQALQLIPKSVCYLCNIECPSWFCCPIAESITYLNCNNVGRDTYGQAGRENVLKSIVNEKPDLILMAKCKKCRSLCVDYLLESDNILSYYIESNKPKLVDFNSKLLGRSGPRAALALSILADAIYGREWESE
ncbi:periplasmic binding protein [Chitinispirillum alkaliphilum]|nr:periplasmic binding protein [Chitinispirillum alkaliphilum]